MLRPSLNDPFIIEEEVYDQESAIYYCENIHKKIIADRESKHCRLKETNK